jgi:acetyltransferase-like isoleucine patch superfamily enzyme
MDYTRDELERMHFAALGENVRVHRTVTFFGCQHLRIGNNVRIDCQAILSAGEGGLFVGNHVHLAAGVFIFGAGGQVVLEDFSGLSSRVTIYTATDDYSEGYLTNPTVPDQYRKVVSGSVILRRHVIVGASSVIMPGVELGLGASVGALSFVTKSVPDFTIVFGCPARKVGERGRKLLDLERTFLAAQDRSAGTAAER